jgi:hypothetical protein
MPRFTSLVGLSASALAAMLLTACSGTVRVDPPTPSGAAAAACRKLVAALPDPLDGAQRVESEPKSPYVAVWGTGEIMLRCGVDRPARMAPTDEVSDINGVAWYADPAKPLLFTAVNRAAYVEVTISRQHASGNVLVDLSEPIKATIPS